MAALTPVTTFQCLESARIHLNDEMGLNWPDNRLLPKFQEAHRELKNELILNGIPVIHEVSAIITVVAGTTDLTTATNYPSDLLIPIWLKERQVGGQLVDFTDMTQVNFLPDVQQEIFLNNWSWIGEKILTNGALIDREVQIRYSRDLSFPLEVNTTIGVMLGETFLSYRTSALAALSIKDYDQAQALDLIAKANLQNVIAFNVKGLQNLPARRQPYHRRYRNGNNWFW